MINPPSSRSSAAKAPTWGFYVRSLVSIALLTIAFMRVDVAKAWEALSDFSIALVALALGLAIAQVVVTSIRWHMLLRTVGIRLPLRLTFEVNILGIFANTLLVNVIGGAVTRVGFLSSRRVPIHSILSTTVLERALIIVVLGVMSVPGLIQIDPTIDFAQAHLLWAGAGATVVAFLLAWLVVRNWRRSRGVQRVTLAIRRFVGDLWAMVIDPGMLTVAVALTVVSQAFLVGTGIAVAAALGAEVSLVQVALMLPAVALIASLPVTIGGLGLRELGAIALLGMIGMSAEQALLLSLAGGVISLLAAVISYGWVLFAWSGRMDPVKGGE